MKSFILNRRRTPFLHVLVVALGVAILSSGVVKGQESRVPLTRVHAHNDYEHPHPLFDALEHGFCSVEADVHLVNGQLLVAHTRSAVKPGQTLQALYLDPIRERVEKNGGSVYPAKAQFTLLIDLKADWHELYPVLRGILKEYSPMLTTYEGGVRHSNAVDVIITGDRSTNMFAGETIRYAEMDGDLENLESGEPADLIPWISSNWSKTFHWRGAGEFPESEKKKIREIVTKAHQQGRRVRFWGAPDTPVFWRMLADNGVDLINTDDLSGAQKFLLEAVDIEPK